MKVLVLALLVLFTSPVLSQQNYSEWPQYNEIGLPYIYTRVQPPNLAALLLGTVDVLNISTSEKWCEFDSILQNWCGGTADKPYTLCLATPIWPNPDADFTNDTFWNSAHFAPNTRVWPGLPAICLCDSLHPNHAVFMAAEFFPIPEYQPGCHVENGLLFLYIFMAIAYFVMGYWALLELIMWVLMFLVKEKSCNILGGFLPKVFIFLACILIIVNCGLITYSMLKTPAWTYAVIWVWIFDAIFLILAYLWWLVVFVDVVIKTAHMKRESVIMIKVSKWFIVLLVTILVIGFAISTGVGIGYAQDIVGNPNWIEKAAINPKYLESRQANILLGCLMIGVTMLWGTFISGYSWFLINQNDDEGSKMWQRLTTMAWWNTLATFNFYMIEATLIIYAIALSWPTYDHFTAYERAMAFGWIWVVQVMFAWIILLSLTMALKTPFAEGEGYCSSILHNYKTIDESRSKGEFTLRGGMQKTSGSGRTGAMTGGPAASVS